MSTSHGKPHTFSDEPQPRTSLSALKHGDKKILIYYQARDRSVWEKVVTPDTKHGYSPGSRTGRTLETLSPLSVIHYEDILGVQPQPRAFYLDTASTLIEAAVSVDAGKSEVNDLEWINVQSISWSRLAALFQPGKGSWLYYQSGRENGIREIWREFYTSSGGHPGFAYRQRYHFEVHDDKRIAQDGGVPEEHTVLNGTDIATARFGDNGSFFYQSGDFSIWEREWNNSTFKWENRLVASGSPIGPGFIHPPSPLTSLSAAYNQTAGVINVNYTDESNKIYYVSREKTSGSWNHARPVEGAVTTPGSRLAASDAWDKSFLVAYETREKLDYKIYSH